ncbi:MULTISPECIES: NlpC/P60 family protein [unclassified Rhodococcus (in: high G+C Gram-positive bacteria)]|uniref:C40 family peptidase n=1 Tax=unclassified Rhodococcus (in: high G+C Gram-positive bacteria) TaxID=192944 RepID=UPI000B9B69DC|nr:MULTISPECIES: bifunctional lytic transglycosylase/C40 family peptidase [unclassified Rhodococcus (in: high G+C Gram-positive bacteria)]MDV7991411.1 bifunctional lytic transglycosylase/C40 family peptidase [Rhodococcus sp. IEGM 1374]OZE33170.1 lytic transglycosylase [Rhodococcus sp. 05-2254-4]OZE43934.1 lytic transglycosylase [Rhodococcus sp. 05-2254-3]OZE56382.1 lytic transglycosylase [Rhodococcus sp. 05-2254-2]
MAGDPFAVIVAVIVSAAGVVAGTDAPAPIPDQAVQDQAADIAANAEDQAKTMSDQWTELLGTMPEPAADIADRTLSDAAEGLHTAAEPMLPDLPTVEDIEAVDTEAADIADPASATDPATATDPAAAATDVVSAAPAALAAAVPSAPLPFSVFSSGAGSSNAVATTAAALGAGAVQFAGRTYTAADIATQTAFMASAEAIRRALFPGQPATFTGINVGAIGLGAVGAITAFVPWLQKAGNICGGVKATTIAALYAAENGFRHGPTAPVSSTGAQGPGQFMPGTWATYGKDYDGNGVTDVNSIGDSVMASGTLLCDIYGQVDGWKREGKVSGDTLDLTLAGYNAGAGAVLRSGGMPSGTFDYETQTKPYVSRIRATETQFAAILTPFAGLDLTGIGGRSVQLAMDYLGLPYVWGGGNINGPSGGGFDCSGLTSYALYKASGGKVTLPRTSETQWNVGTEIPMAMAQPGDLLFGNFGPAGPGHVAIYMGNGQMVHAPTTGDVVRVAPVFDGMRARHIV